MVRILLAAKRNARKRTFTLTPCEVWRRVLPCRPWELATTTLLKLNYVKLCRSGWKKLLRDVTMSTPRTHQSVELSQVRNNNMIHSVPPIDNRHYNRRPVVLWTLTAVFFCAGQQRYNYLQGIAGIRERFSRRSISCSTWRLAWCKLLVCVFSLFPTQWQSKCIWTYWNCRKKTYSWNKKSFIFRSPYWNSTFWNFDEKTDW